MRLKRKCPVCGADEGEWLYKIPLNISAEMRKKINYPQSYDVVCCNNCGMLFADSSLSKEDVDEYYIHCNMYDNASNVKKDTYLEGCELYYSAILPYITMESEIIDVGCGNGNFLKFLKDKGYSNLYGLDPSESSINELKQNGIKGIVGSVYDEIPDKFRNRYDIVILSGVLEHLLFPDICLENIINLIKKNGVLYIVVPNAEGFRKYLREVPNYFNHEHINYFTSNTLDYICNKNGLSRCSSDENCYHVVTPASPEMVISAAYKFSTSAKEDVCFDDAGKASVKEYFHLIEQKQNRNRVAIRNLLKEDTKIIIWGTGGLAASLLNDIPELLDKVECFVDNDTHRQSIHYYGKKVVSPDELHSHPLETIMICIMINRDSVVKQIQDMKLSNKLFLLS